MAPVGGTTGNSVSPRPEASTNRDAWLAAGAFLVLLTGFALARWASLPLYRVPRVNVAELQRLKLLRHSDGYCLPASLGCCCVPSAAAATEAPARPLAY